MRLHSTGTGTITPALRLGTLLLSALLLFSCSDGKTAAGQKAAEGFMKAFFKEADYRKAALYCEGTFKETVLELAEEVESLEEVILLEFKELSSQIRLSCTGTSTVTEDSLVADFEIFVPDDASILTNRVHLTYDPVTESWFVSDMTE